MPSVTEKRKRRRIRTGAGSHTRHKTLGCIGTASPPEKQAEAVIFLGSDEASYFNGLALLVNRGPLLGYYIHP